MNALDIVILAVIGISTLSALWRGLVSEVLSLVVWALALWTSATFSGSFAQSVLSGVEPASVRMGAAYLTLFFAVLIAGGLCNWTLRTVLKKTGLSGTDRMLGGLFGLARGALAVFAAVLFAGFTQIPAQPVWQQSVLMPSVQTLALLARDQLPESVRNYVHFPSTLRPVQNQIPDPNSKILPQSADVADKSRGSGTEDKSRESGTEDTSRESGTEDTSRESGTEDTSRGSRTAGKPVSGAKPAAERSKN